MDRTEEAIRAHSDKGEVTIRFIKADGSERDMRFTTDYAALAVRPGFVAPKGGKAPEINGMRVFDLDINEWRSFRYDRLVSIVVGGETIPFD